jgi:hypothetical protein
MPEDFFDLPPLPDPDVAKAGTRDYSILQWCDERVRQGQEFIEAQVGYDKIDKAISAIFAYEKKSGASYAPAPKALSNTFVNLVAITAEDITAMLTDARVFWSYTTNNPKYEAQVRLCNKDAEAWYTSRNIDLRMGDVVRYYCVAGTGYAHLYYSRRLGDMMVEAEDPRNVIPIGPISYHSLQDAEGVVTRRARTPAWVKAEYGKDVAPDTGAQSIFGWFLKAMGSVTNKSSVSGPLSPDRKHADSPIPKTPTVFVNTMYLNDTRVNPNSHDVYMGGWETDLEGQWRGKNPWSYVVKPGMPLYPFKRMIVWGGGVKLYDDTSPYWHGMYPVVKMTLNPWPMSFLGKAPLWDILPLNESMNGLLRVIDDNAAQHAQPGAVADRNVSRAEFNKFNSRIPGYKMRTNMASGKGITIVPPPSLPQSLWQHVDKIEKWIQQLAGTANIDQMANLNQVPSADTIDAIMKAQTPGVRSRSRIMEGFAREFGMMYLSCIAEFDTLSKRIDKFGVQAVTAEDFDYDPHTMIPDDVPDGSPGDIGASLDAFASDGPRPMYERWAQVARSIATGMKSSSLLNSAGQQDRMEDFMLSKMGYLSIFSLMDSLGRKNFAPPGLIVPADEIGRLNLQQQLGIGMIANSQGRKSTDQKAPAMGQNANGPTITTSG